jgi:hypothetical protein
MPSRTPALLAVMAIFGLSAYSPVTAQPQVPVRPRYTTFQNVFLPGQQPQVNPGAGFLGQGLPFGNPGGPQVPGFVYPGTLNYPQSQPTVFALDPRLRPTGIVATFNNTGHWYGARTIGGGLGHWYPNGFANGRGVLGFGAGYGMQSYGAGGSSSAGFGGSGGSLLGTAMTAGAAFNQLRR